ncbi:MAG TPA: protein-glutamine gamma-glutamyltransferase [Paenibacillus sp.]|nr:protein-glutamine gamma-glutamyltransferase [Paenibacillus sp.]
MIHIMQGAGDASVEEAKAPPMRRALLRLVATRTAGEYPTVREFDFEVRLREATLEAARALNDSGAAFATFDQSRCNVEYWRREANGAFRLRPDRRPSAAVRDIFANGPMYAFECATAIVIVFYKATLEAIGDAAFDRLFANTYLFHWNVDRDLGLTTVPTVAFVPGDCLYFDNPDVDPETMHWQGENVIFLGPDLYYGHGIGIRGARDIIAKLNGHRRPGATRSAHLLSQATRPDYVKLSQSAAATPGSDAGGGIGLPVWPGGTLFRARIGDGLYIG